jgi:hypothetical protein
MDSAKLLLPCQTQHQTLRKAVHWFRRLMVRRHPNQSGSVPTDLTVKSHQRSQAQRPQRSVKQRRMNNQRVIRREFIIGNNSCYAGCTMDSLPSKPSVIVVKSRAQ